MIFGENSVTEQVAYPFYGSILLFVDSYKELGITIDSGLKFHAHTHHVIGKAGTLIDNLLRSTVCRFVDFMMILYISYFRSNSRVKISSNLEKKFLA